MRVFAKILGIAFILTAFALVRTTGYAFAVTPPSFATCPNPSGNVIASYDTGLHGIAGDFTTHTGSDSVYQTSETTLTQCFCPTTGTDGIQSNWWNASQLSQSDITALENSGWIFVPNGSAWGLTSDPYLVQNISFSCGGSNGGGSTLGSSTSNDPHDPITGTGTGGQVLGASTTVLGATSSEQLVARVVMAILLSLGILLVLI